MRIAVFGRVGERSECERDGSIRIALDSDCTEWSGETAWVVAGRVSGGDVGSGIGSMWRMDVWL
jgi:hypothetical protein